MKLMKIICVYVYSTLNFFLYVLFSELEQHVFVIKITLNSLYT